MKAAATNISHVAEVDAFVTVNWCWFPGIFLISEGKGYPHEQERTTKHLHGRAVPSACEPVIVILEGAPVHKTYCLYIFHDACLEFMVRPQGQWGTREPNEQRNDSRCMWFMAAMQLSIMRR